MSVISIFSPRKPPAALISSTAICAPSWKFVPATAPAPESSHTQGILTVSSANATPAVRLTAAARALAARNFRLFIPFPPFCLGSPIRRKSVVWGSRRHVERARRRTAGGSAAMVGRRDRGRRSPLAVAPRRWRVATCDVRSTSKPVKLIRLWPLGRRTTRNHAAARQDDPIAAALLNSYDAPGPRDKIPARNLLRTIAAVNDRDAVPHILDAITLEQRPRVVGSGCFVRGGRFLSCHQRRLFRRGGREGLGRTCGRGGSLLQLVEPCRNVGEFGGGRGRDGGSLLQSIQPRHDIGEF